MIKGGKIDVKFYAYKSKTRDTRQHSTQISTSHWEIKAQLLNGFVATTGYDRKYAIKLLNGKVKRPLTVSKRRGQSLRYDGLIVQILKKLWHAGNQSLFETA